MVMVGPVVVDLLVVVELLVVDLLVGDLLVVDLLVVDPLMVDLLVVDLLMMDLLVVDPLMVDLLVVDNLLVGTVPPSSYSHPDLIPGAQRMAERFLQRMHRMRIIVHKARKFVIHGPKSPRIMTLRGGRPTLYHMGASSL